MVRTQWLSFGLLVGALVLAACGPGSPVAPAAVPTLTPFLAGPTSGPTAVSALQTYSSPDFGFSLSYPAGYELQIPFPHSLIFLAPQGTQGHRERGSLTVEQTFDQTAEWYANQAKEENANLGIAITPSVQVLDGQQAYILGRLPGQDLNRQVFIVNNGLLYHLTFRPDDPAAGEDYQQMENLYTAVIGSLRFLPDHRAIAPITEISNMIHHLERALNARSGEDMARLLGDEFVLGNLNPATAEGVTFSRYGSTEVIPMILDNQLSQAPAVSLQQQVDWASVAGSLDTYAGIFPGEVVTPILAKGWGPNGTDQAVIIIARRIDNSLVWRGAFVLQ